MATALGGLNRGLVQGLGLGSQLGEAKAERGRAERKEKRQQLMIQEKALASLFANKTIDKDYKAKLWNGPYKELMKELTGIDLPTVTGQLGANIEKIIKEVDATIQDPNTPRNDKIQSLTFTLRKLEDPVAISHVEHGIEDLREEKDEVAAEQKAQAIKREEAQFGADKIWLREQPGSDFVGPPRREDVERMARISGDPERAKFLMNSMKMDEDKARQGGTDIVIKKSPVTGQLMGIDRNKPGEPPVLVPSPGFPGKQGGSSITQSQEELETVITQETLRKGTGPFSATIAFMSNVFGPFVPGLSGTAKENKEARKSLAVFSQRAKSALLNSSRGAIWEQQILEGRILPTSKIFTDPRAEFAGLIKLRDILKEELSFQKEVLQQPTLDLSTRKKIISNNIELETLIRQISEGKSQDSDVEFVNNLTDIEVDGLSEDDFRGMSKEAQDAVISRLEARQNISGGGVSGEF